ncbi:MAG: translocation/assembly module TamB domain-containing protein [Myxococcales bacterium]|nr:translocation/assembly module TamB domain-containing protein [Myxococcales bacterium]
MEDRPSLLPERLSALPQRLSAVFKPRRGRRYAARVAAGLGLGSVFLASTVAGLLLHLSTEEARRVTQRAANALLPSVLDGRIELGEIEELSLTHARIGQVWIYDPAGHEVIHAEGVDARVSTLRLLRSIFLEDGPVRLTISRTRIERANVSFFTDDANIPTLATTFLPRDKTPSVGPPGRAFVLRMPRIEIGEARAAGSVGVDIDADVRRVGASVYVDTSDFVAVDVDRAHVTERSLLETRLSGAASYHMRYDLLDDDARIAEHGPHPPDRLSMTGELSGTIGSIPASAVATMVGLDLEARAVLPSVEPKPLAEVIPWLALTRTVSARASVSGSLPHLSFEGSAEIPQGAGMGTVTAEGALDFQDGLELRADALAEEVDPRLLSESIPEARISGRARVDVTVPKDQAPAIGIELATRAAEIGGQILPAVDAVVALHEGEVLASATVYEAGIPLDVRLALTKDGAVRYSAVGESSDVAESPRVAPYLAGAGRLRVDGSYRQGSLDTTVQVDLRGATTRVGPAMSAATTSVVAKVTGSLDALEVDGRLGAKGLTLFDEQLDQVDLVAKGPLLAPVVSASVKDAERGSIEAAGKVSVPDKSITNLSAKIARAGVEARGRAARISIGPSGPVVTGLSVTGTDLGEVDASLSVDRGDLVGKLSGRDVDLDKLARLLGLPLAVEGLASFDVDVDRTNAGRVGHIELELEDGKLLGVDGVSTRVSAKLSGRDVKVTGFVRLVDDAPADIRSEALKRGLLGSSALCDGVVAELRFADAKASLEGALLDPRAWRRAIGSADLVAENWNLACLAERLPGRSNPFEEVAGIATARARLARRQGDPEPSVEDFALATRGLVVVTKEAGFESRRLDLTAEGGFDGKTGTASLETIVRGSAFRAEATAAAILDLAKLLDPATRQASLKNTQFEVNLTLPRRPLSELAALPDPLGESIPALDGELRLEVEAWGTPAHPELAVHAKGFGVAQRTASTLSSPLLPPLDLALDTTFDPTENRIDADLEITVDKRAVAAGTAAVEADLRKLLMPDEQPFTWKADLFAQLFDLPLASLPILADRNVTGMVSGRLSLKGLHDQPSVDGALSFRDVTVGDVGFDGRVEATIAPRAKEDIAGVDTGAIDAVATAQRAGDASLRVDIDQTDGGGLQVLAYAGASWDDLVVPTVDTQSAGGFALSAKRFRLGTLHPLVADVVSRLDGRVEGSMAVEWGRLGEAMQGRFSDAKLDLSDVVVFIPQLGQELRDGRGAIRLGAASRGRTGQEINLERFEARGTSGRIEGEASAAFQGLRFLEATGKLSIKQGEELPITVEGVPIGKARGEAALTLTPTNPGDASQRIRELNLGVKLSNTLIQLPASSGRNVQSLDPARGVLVLQPIEAPQEKRSGEALRWIVTVEVDDAAVQSSMLDTRLSTVSGAPVRVVLSDRLHASGDVALTRGFIQLQDRRFVIDQALVRLRDEDASNPYVNLTAHWDAADGSRIFVDYVGVLQPITDDKIKFRSDPPRSQAEILALLIFGETDASGTGGTANSLVGTVGSTVATSIAGDLVSAVFGGVIQDVAVNVGATEQGNYYGAQVSVAEDWRIGGQYEQLGGSSNSTTNTSGGTVGQRRGGCADLFADWSFARNWSIRGSTGYCSYEDDTTSGSSSQQFNLGIDVLWQYRY